MPGAERLDASEVDPVRVRRVEQVWISHVASCEEVVHEIVEGAKSPGGACRPLEFYLASGLKEERRLTEVFDLMQMDIGELPRLFIMQMPTRQQRSCREDDVIVVILNGFSKVRLLECSDDINPPRSKILRSLTNQCQRRQKWKTAASGEALIVTA